MPRRPLRLVALTLAVVSGFAAAGRGQNLPPALDALQGEWELFAHELDGKRDGSFRTLAIPFTTRYTFRGDRLTVAGSHGSTKHQYTATVRLTPGTPAGIDLVVPVAGGKTEVLRGVYEVREGSLRVRFAKSGSEARPASLAAKTGEPDPPTSVFLRPDLKGK